MSNIKIITKELTPLYKSLREHNLYDTLNNLNDIKLFMENHVFAVWDFMSLIKSLEQNLKKNQIPWTINKNNDLLKSISTIIASEEYDEDENGICKSHFEIYLEAMEQTGANTSKILKLINNTTDVYSVSKILDELDVSEEVSQFVNYTFFVINSKKPHLIASLFAFGRESIIPEIFIELVKSISTEDPKINKFLYYLKRHIELDSDEHSQLAFKIVSSLIGQDKVKLKESIMVAKNALLLRIKLWDSIVKKKMIA